MRTHVVARRLGWVATSRKGYVPKQSENLGARLRKRKRCYRQRTKRRCRFHPRNLFGQCQAGTKQTPHTRTGRVVHLAVGSSVQFLDFFQIVRNKINGRIRSSLDKDRYPHAYVRPRPRKNDRPECNFGDVLISSIDSEPFCQHQGQPPNRAILPPLGVWCHQVD